MGFAWTEIHGKPDAAIGEIRTDRDTQLDLNDTVAGFISLVDQPRPEAKRAVDELKKMGIKQVIMITGDNPYSAARTAKEMGIDRFYSQVLPQDKLKIIRDLQAEGHKVHVCRGWSE